MRPYTPINDADTVGHVDFVIKKYPDGAMTSKVHGLQPGDEILIKGPILKLDYKPNAYKKIGMIAGGTGITPMLQVIRKVLDNPADETRIELVFGNVSSEDILLKETLDGLQKTHGDRFKVHYLIDKPEDGWRHETGYVSEAMVKKYMPQASEQDSLVVVCGPPPMMKAVCGPKGDKGAQGELGGLLKNMAYTSDNVFKF